MEAQLHEFLPNVAVACVALYILKVRGSDLGPETDYPRMCFAVFLNLSTQKPGQYLKLRHERFLPHPFQFIHHPTIRRYI
jgi:hypothetical protein